MIVLMFLLSLVLAAVSEAATYYVATSGGLDSRSCATATNIATPKQTITSGTTCLGAGDTLFVRGGTYVEVIDGIPSGTAGNVVTVAAYNGETVMVQPGSGDHVLDWSSTTNWTVMDGIIIDATSLSGGSQVHGVVTSGGTHNVFQHGEVRNAMQGRTCGGTGTNSQNFALGGSFNIVQLSRIHDNLCEHGFYITGHDNIVQDNEIDHNGEMGVQIFEGSFPTKSTDAHIIRRNRIHDNGFGTAGHGYGGTISKGQDCLFYNNLVYGNYGGLSISNNGTNEQAYNNSFYNNGPGTALEYFSSTNTKIINNLTFGNTVNGVTDFGGNVGATVTTNTSTDPNWVNAASGDFHLQASSSAAIDQGTSLSSFFTTDLDGVTRPQGSAWDIGAYEFASGGAPVPHVVRVIR